MAANELPRQQDRLFALGADVIDGLQAHEAGVGVLQNTAVATQATLAAAINAEATFDQAQLAKKAKLTAQQIADSNARAFLSSYRRVLENVVGKKYSPAWAAAGFEGNSTAVPTTIGERETLALRARDHLNGPVGAQYVNAGMGVTVALADAAYTQLRDARGELNNALNAGGATKAARDTAVEALRTRLRGLIDELGQLLSDDDPRWYAFGLNRPGDPETPETPEGLVLTPGAAGSGTVYADWGDARRAKRHRVWRQVVGVDAEFIAIATREVSDATLDSQPVGATVKYRITAANDAGESQPSAEQQIVVP